MADKNAKAELNAEDLEGVAGGVMLDRLDDSGLNIVHQGDQGPLAKPGGTVNSSEPPKEKQPGAKGVDGDLDPRLLQF